MKNIKLIIGLILEISCTLGFSQNQTGCNYPQSNDFDFWIGEWNVYDTLGNKVGENTLLKQYENCVLQENWESANVNKGTSYNYFNPADSTWNQLWLDNQGSILKLKGGLINGNMVLKSELIPGKKVAKYYNQITWHNNSDGTVNQVWDVFDENNNKLQTLFFGVYKRKEN